MEAGQIRVFVLQQGSETDALQGQILNTSFGYQQPEYEAVSYVWGNTDETSTICIDDNQVAVTRSLESALRHLRLRERPRRLWIDYICVDQSNVAERNLQLRLMPRIYESAQTVNIWLGEATVDSPMGMQILDYFAHEAAPHSQPPWKHFPPLLVYNGLSDVMQRPWFKRMWVVQETVLSKSANMICGRSSFSWDSTDPVAVRRFVRMIKYAEISPDWQRAGLEVIDMRPFVEILDLQIGNQLDRSWGSTHRSAPDLLDITHAMRHRLSTDPRDKIFALAGITEHILGGGEDLNPDYLMTVQEAYDHLRSVVRF